MEIENRLAVGLGIDSLRMVEHSIEHRKIWWHNGTIIANIIFPLTIAGCIAAATYAWFVR